MISLSPITYSAYFDDYFVSLKEYSCHVNLILCPHEWNIFIYMENISFTWKKYYLKILCC